MDSEERKSLLDNLGYTLFDEEQVKLFLKGSNFHESGGFFESDEKNLAPHPKKRFRQSQSQTWKSCKIPESLVGENVIIETLDHFSGNVIRAEDFDMTSKPSKKKTTSAPSLSSSSSSSSSSQKKTP